MSIPTNLGFHAMMENTFRSGPQYELVETFRQVGVPVTHSHLFMKKLKEYRFKRNFQGISVEDRSKMMADLRLIKLDCSFFGMMPSMVKEHIIDANIKILSQVFLRYAPGRDLTTATNVLKHIMLTM